jgi:hypothetical protein
VPLPIDGFRIQFGSSNEKYEERYADDLIWVGAPDDLGIAHAVAHGEDVALLKLSKAAPRDAAPLAVDFDYVPRSRDRVSYAGFGVSSTATGKSGERLRADGRVTGLDPKSGIMQIDGPSACLGDSGGPVLLASAGALIGILGQVGSSEDGGLCDLGLSFAYTVINPRVRDLLKTACDRDAACGTPANEAPIVDAAVIDAGTAVDVPDRMHDSGRPDPSNVVDGGELNRPDSGDSEERGAGCDCDLSGRRRARVGLSPFFALAAGWLRIRARRRR